MYLRYASRLVIMAEVTRRHNSTLTRRNHSECGHMNVAVPMILVETCESQNHSTSSTKNVMPELCNQ